MKQRIKQKLRCRRGEGVVQLPFVMVMLLLCVAFFLTVSPAIMTKWRLDNFANELCREAEISGRVGDETMERTRQLREVMGIDPDIAWSARGNIPLGEEVTVKLETTVDLGFFTFTSSPITVTAKATGRSEVYWKTS